jgi:DNA polymerase-3 subunit beta
MISEELRTYDLFIEKFKIDFGKKQLILKGLITQEEKDRLINIAANEIIEEAIDNLYIKFEEFSKHNKISVIANEKNKITVKTKKGKYTLSGESTEEFPAPEEKEDLNKIEFNNINFRKYLSTTIHAASTDDLRKNMAGILLDIRGKDIRMVATDGFRLCKYTTQKAKHKISKSEKVIIPHKTCSLILKLSEGEKSVIEFDSSMIKVIFDSTEIFSKLIDENFPNYETVIPKDNDKILKINRRDFQESLERIKIFADESTHRIKLEIKNSELNIKADNPEKGAEGEDSLDCSFIKNDSQDADFDAEPFNIAFNAGYLLECIKQINTDDVIFSFSTTSKASIATPSEQEGDEEYMELVMPVRVG